MIEVALKNYYNKQYIDGVLTVDAQAIDGHINLNDFIEYGTYHVYGEITYGPEVTNIPMQNHGGGNTIDAMLWVLDSSLPNVGAKDDDVCITQFLILSNRAGGAESDIFIRSANGTTKETLTWKPWEKYQTNVEVGVVTNEYTINPSTFTPIEGKGGINSLIDNGIYSGVLLDETGELSAANPLNETFVMVVINNYALVGGENKTITQIKFSTLSNGSYTSKTRSKGIATGDMWTAWQNMNSGGGSSNNNIGEGTIIGSNVNINDGATIGMNAKVGQNTTILGGTNIGAYTTIADGVLIEQAVTIQEGATVGKDAWVMEEATIEKAVTIGEDTIIGKSVNIGRSVNIGDGANIGDALIGSGVVIGDNVTVGSDINIESGVYFSSNATLGADSYVGDTAYVYDYFDSTTFGDSVLPVDIQQIESVSAPNTTINLNEYYIKGTYRIFGEVTYGPEVTNLPMQNHGGGNTIDAMLYVLDSSLPNIGAKEDDVCITQFLILSNRTGGAEGDMFMRSANGTTSETLTWKPWEKYQTNVEVGVVTDSSLRGFVDNGIYSGICLSGSPVASPTDPITETFVMLVINNYMLTGENKTISQIKFGVDNTGRFTFTKRQKIGSGYWGNWVHCAAYPKYKHGTADTTYAINPNEFHVWGQVSNLNINLSTNTSLGLGGDEAMREYTFQFTSGPTPTVLSLPASVKFTSELIIEPNRIYQISIVDNLGTALCWSSI